MLLLLAVVAALKLTVLGSMGLDMWRQLAAQDIVPIPKALAAESHGRGGGKPSATAAGRADGSGTPAMLAENAVPPARVGETRQTQNAYSREAELAARERALKSMEQSVDAKLAELKRVEASIRKLLDQADALKDARIKREVVTYQAMKPRQAAAVLSTMDENLAVRILTGMKPKAVGEIMSYMKTDQAARLTEAMSRFQVMAPGGARAQNNQVPPGLIPQRQAPRAPGR